ncbi:efflux RND transporter periplasmic adaptor subunit [Pseudoalteromonas sp. CO325X]|uniref:efflux RND transporter periplasmic adaptor subunit n=1 Tax=Pseudoalteromonas sp. CO325X TaxID=1777262 RepID=UPI001F0ECFA4|nr:efflux RND transporter periplasmic adaptor subunit [Pseudoalteromonas sp. CO325X]
MIRAWCICLLLISGCLSAQTAVNVVVKEVNTQSIERTLALTGTLRAARHAQLSSLSDGVVTQIHAQAGDEVAKGARLLSLDAALVQAQLQALTGAKRRARIAVDDVQRRFNEAQSLSQQALMAATELADRQAALQSAKASLTEAQANERYHKELLARQQLHAPFSGVVAERFVDVGEWVTRGQAVFELVSSEQLWLDLHMPQEHFGAIDLAKQVRFEVPGKASRGFTAKVIAKVPVIDSASRSFLLRLAVPPQAGLQVGLSASAEIVLNKTDEQSVVVPTDALLRHPDGGYSVFVISADKAQRRFVRIGERINGHIEVLSGLEPGMKVVTQGNELLRQGQAVTVVQAREQ